MNDAVKTRAIEEALAGGLPLVSRPYQVLAERLGLSEADVLACVRESVEEKSIRRLGAVVRHRPFGYIANAMCVWNIPDADVSEIGKRLARFPFVTLCYRRKRALPEWPYNLYCMIHGKDRADVLAQWNVLVTEAGLTTVPSQVLFSTQEFKQRGSRKNDLATALVRDLQRGIPVVDRPFQQVAERFHTTEIGVVEELKWLLDTGRLSRFGPMINVEHLGGAFILAAMEVPAERFEAVNAAVNRRVEVAHNYEREHRLNMWFVVATTSVDRAFDVCREIETETGLRVYAMPKEKEFFLELMLDV